MGQMVETAILTAPLPRGREQGQVARRACVLESVRYSPQQSLWHTDTHKARGRDSFAVMDYASGGPAASGWAAWNAVCFAACFAIRLICV